MARPPRTDGRTLIRVRLPGPTEESAGAAREIERAVVDHALIGCPLPPASWRTPSTYQTSMYVSPETAAVLTAIADFLPRARGGARPGAGAAAAWLVAWLRGVDGSGE